MRTARPPYRRRGTRLLAFALASAASAAAALAVSPSHWVHTSEADFNNGTFKEVVATNLGDLKLSRGVKTLLEQDPRVSAVYALAQAPDGAIYAATGPEGVLLRIKDDSVGDAADLEETTSLFAVTVDPEGRVLFGTGGETGRVMRIDKPGAEPTEVFSDDEAQYVWALQVTPDGNTYVATGPHGKLFEVKPDGSKRVVLDSNENNLLSLASDGKDLLYAGTDPHGLVYRVNRRTGEVFVVHDAEESEITTLALAPDGTLYAGTAEAVEGEAAEAAEAAPGGRPEGGSGAVPIPSTPPDEPEPPEMPDPNPGEPDPIPKSSSAAPAAIERPVLLLAEPMQEEPTPPEAPEPPDSPEPSPGMPGAPEPAEPTAPVAPPPPDTMSADAGAPREGGNAVYRIDTNGFVTEIFRENVLVLSLFETNGTLIVGTGSEGRVYQINPRAEETLVLAKLEPKQVMCLLPAKDGRIFLGMANTGGVAAMTSGYAASGTYTSPVLDASQISRFGQLRLSGRLPQGTELLVATRSGNLSEPTEAGWSKWTDDVPATEYLPIQSPAARFLQYRLTFRSADGKQTAVVDEADVAYQVPNLAPRVTSITAASAEAAADASVELGSSAAPTSRGSGKQTLTWEATDQNSDTMRYELSFRAGSRSPWIQLAKDLTETTYEWDTRSVADGRYEVRVTASDALANPKGAGKTGSRVSDPILVDNTAPVIGDVKSAVKGADAEVTFTAADRSSPLYSFEYSVNSSKDWQAVLPSDNIADGPVENVRFSVTGLTPGLHQVAVRATDARGNQAVQTVTVTVEAAARR